MKMKPDQNIKAGCADNNTAILHVGDVKISPPVIPRELDSSQVAANSRSLKRRGRKSASVPNANHFKILMATKAKTYAEVGAENGISRQRVAEIARRWKTHLPVRRLPPREVAMNKQPSLSPKARQNRTHIVCFRLTTAEIELLRFRYPKEKSVNRAARGVMIRALSI